MWWGCSELIIMIIIIITWKTEKMVMDLGLGWAYLLGVHGITTIYFKKAMSEDQERHSP